MKTLKFIKSKLSQKKGRKIFSFLPFFLPVVFLFVTSCAADPSKYGRVTLHNTADKNSFVFSVNEEFLSANSGSAADKKFPKMTEAEMKLLIVLLKQKEYCLNEYGVPSFLVTSRQEKIYDMTFAHLIEENYNARPIAPRMYFGQCQK